MGIDFSKKPEGATHVAVVGDNYARLCWYKFDADGRYQYSYQRKGCEAARWTSSYGEPTHRPLIECPSPAWRGPEDGLPPVGMELEVLYNSTPEIYVTCKVLAHDNDRAVYRFTGGPRKGEYQSDRQWFDADAKRVMFRHIPTAEQIAMEERDREVNKMADIAAPLVNRYFIAERLYDAGYRLPEVK